MDGTTEGAEFTEGRQFRRLSLSTFIPDMKPEVNLTPEDTECTEGTQFRGSPVRLCCVVTSSPWVNPRVRIFHCLNRPRMLSDLSIMSSPIATSYGHVGHSAEVKMRLEIGDATLPVAQLGPDFLIVRTPVEHAPTDAVLYFSIDGNERRRDIHLPEGISAARTRTPIKGR